MIQKRALHAATTVVHGDHDGRRDGAQRRAWRRPRRRAWRRRGVTAAEDTMVGEFQGERVWSLRACGERVSGRRVGTNISRMFGILSIFGGLEKKP
jgi:hypothetical protein